MVGVGVILLVDLVEVSVGDVKISFCTSPTCVFSLYICALVHLLNVCYQWILIGQNHTDSSNQIPKQLKYLFFQSLHCEFLRVI